MPSVKRVHVAERPDGGLGRGRFEFTDAYSVFDWGQMPDSIPGKGASLCAMGAHTFEALADEGVPTHYRGVVDGDGVVDLGGVTTPPREMAVDIAAVPDLPHDGGYDYGRYHAAAGDHYLVPLEVVFRNTVPAGSSLRRRTTPADHGLDTEEWPDGPVDLVDPVVEFSTKFERSDRYLDRAEADRIAGPADIGAIESVARTVNRVVTDLAADAGLEHQDGKIEVLYAAGEVRVADVAGTFDENRFAHDGQQVSKEVLRQYYRREHPGWVEDVETAKRTAKTEGREDWTALCESTPPSLPDRVVAAAGDLYRAGANAYLGRQLFDAPHLEAAVAAVEGV